MRKFLSAAAFLAICALSFIPTGAQSAPIFEQISPDPTVYTLGNGLDFTVYSLSGVGDVTAKVQYVPPVGGGGSGCDAGGFAGFVAGSIALISRGTCAFVLKMENAQAAGAAGVLIANNVAGGAPGMGGVPSVPLTIPVFSTSLEIGQDFLAKLDGGSVTVRMSVDAVPGPVVGAGLPGLILAFGGLLAWRRRNQAATA